MAEHRCYVCNDKGFCLEEGDVVPCPMCNPDSDVGPKAYRKAMIKSRGRCEYIRGGGGRVCKWWNGHTGPHVFECGT